MHDNIDQKGERFQGGNASSQRRQRTIALDHTVNISKTSLIVKGKKLRPKALFLNKSNFIVVHKAGEVTPRDRNRT